MFLKNLGQASLGGAKSQDNIFALYSPAFGCCGDNEDKAIACRYMTVIDTASVTTAGSFRINGVTYTFDATWATTTTAGRVGIVNEIKAIMAALGYSFGSLYWTNLTGAIWALHFDFSALVPEWLNASGNQFVPVSCLTVGHKTSLDTGFSIFVTKLANGTYDVTIKIYAGTTISAFAITYNAVSVTAAVPAGNSYTWNATALLAEAETALIVSITPTGGSIVTKTLTEKLSNYKA